MIWWILLLILGVLTGLVITGQKKAGQRPSGALLYALVTLAFLVIVVIMVRSFGTPNVRVVKDFYEVEGVKLGEAITDALEGGQVLVFQPLVASDAQRKINTARIEGLMETLATPAYEIVELTAEKETEVDPSMPVLVTTLSAERLLEALAGHPDAAAIVSFDGFPAQYPRGAPPVYLGHVHEVDMAEALLRGGRIKAFVRYQPGFDPQSKPSRGMTLDEVFAMRYELVTR